MLHYYRLGIEQTILLFALYSFAGWAMEVVYRSFEQKRFVNAGFLMGPFVPIYGFGAAAVVLLSLVLKDILFPLQVVVFGIVTTALEFIVGYLVEKRFGFKLWDYTDNAWNYRGIVCPLYSLLWTFFSVAFIYVIHPFAYDIVEKYYAPQFYAVSYLYAGYFVIDMTVSILALSALRNNFTVIFHQYLELSQAEIGKIATRFRRLFRAFPDLNRYMEKNIRHDLKEKISEIFSLVNGRLVSLKPAPADDREFYAIVGEITANSEYQRLKNFYHHSSSIYEHIMNVAYLSYRMAKYLKLDFRSATRGALLHDFFCYDWRNHDLPDLAREKYHGIEHPKIALANAEKHFILNDIERDVIIKHMWPLTIIPPKYRESYVVTVADKVVSSLEYGSRFINSGLVNRLKKLTAVAPRRKRS